MKDDNTPIDESQLDERFAVEGAVPQEDLNSPSDIIDRNKPSAISFYVPGERDIVDQTNSHIRFFIHQRDGRKHPVSIWWHKGNDKGYIREKEPYLDYTYHDVYFNIPFKGAGGYEAIWWHSSGGQSLSSFRGVYVSDRPVIDSVQVFNNIITGGGGELSTLKIRTSGGAQDITYDFTSNGGKWSAPVLSSVHPAHYDVVVEQRVQGYTTRYSVEERILYLAAPKFALTNDQTVKLDTTVQIAGTWGAPGQQIQVANENGGVKYGETNALSNGDWGIILAAKENFPNGGRVVLNARHTLSGNEAWARLSLFLLAPPTIDAIPAEVEINVQIKGAGHSDISENSVDVFLDPSSVQIGSGRVQSGRWFADLKLEPGRWTITAAQLYTSITSERAAPRVFKVRPPTPELKSRQVEGRTELHGTGYTGAKVDVHVPTVGTPFLWAEVISGLWSVAIPDTILPGNKKYLCRQSVSDGQGGSIFSTGWTDEITVNVPTPKPMVRTPTVSGQQVTFSGTGNRWDNATVQVVIFRNGIVLDAVPKANVLPTLQWTTSAVLPPGIYDNLTTTQWVNGQHSAAIAVASVVIVPLAPGVNPIEDNSFSPRFSGTCWQGATISLLFSDSDQPGTHMDTDKDGKWTFTRGAPFVPGDHTVRINQTFGGQAQRLRDPSEQNMLSLGFNKFEVGDRREANRSPVFDEGESVRVMLQILAAGSTDGARGVEVVWETPSGDVITSTGMDGWTELTYQPEKEGAGELVARVKNRDDNDEARIEESFNFTAITSNFWKQHVELVLDPDNRLFPEGPLDFYCLRGNTLTLQIKPIPGGQMLGKSVGLRWRGEDPGLGMSFSPPLGQTFEWTDEGLVWTLTAGGHGSGWLELDFFTDFQPLSQAWELSGRLISDSILDEGIVEFDSSALSPDMSYPSIGAVHAFRFMPNPMSALSGLHLQMLHPPQSEDPRRLGIKFLPDLYKDALIELQGVEWSIDCIECELAAGFELGLSIRAGSERLRIVGLSMSLGHNRLEFSETREPTIHPVIEEQEAAYVSYRVCSFYTKEPVENVLVTFQYQGSEVAVSSGADGWATYACQPETLEDNVVTACVFNLYNGEPVIAENTLTPLLSAPWKDVVIKSMDDFYQIRLGEESLFPRRDSHIEYLIAPATTMHPIIEQSVRLGWTGTPALELESTPEGPLGAPRIMKRGGLQYGFSFGNKKDGSFGFIVSAKNLLKLSPVNSMSLGDHVNEEVGEG